MAQRNVIHRALASHLYDNFSGASKVAWENTKYEPTDLTTIWFEEVFIPNDSGEASIGLAGTQNDFGLYQINVRVPVNTGTIQADDFIDELSQLYSFGTILEKDGEKIYIEGSSASQGITDDNWYLIPFTISWSCIMTKN